MRMELAFRHTELNQKAGRARELNMPRPSNKGVYKRSKCL
jgi:hypothetical protein